jgi:hypothetical protein
LFQQFVIVQHPQDAGFSWSARHVPGVVVQRASVWSASGLPALWARGKSA